MESLDFVTELTKLRQTHMEEIGRINSAINVLEGRSQTQIEPSDSKHRRRRMSDESRHNISLAQQRRWRRQRAQMERQGHSATTRKSRNKHWTQRPENRKRMIALTRKMTRMRQ